MKEVEYKFLGLDTTSFTKGVESRG